MITCFNFVILFIVKCFVFIFTYLTLPVYYLLQKPWKSVKKANLVRAVKTDPSDPSAAWIRVGHTPNHEVIKINTLDELLDKMLLCHGKHHPCLGVRLGFGPEAFYQWFTVVEIIKRVVNIAKGFKQIGLEKGDLVVIFADTCLDWILCSMAIYRLGGHVVALAPEFGHSEIVDAVNRTQAKYAITTRLQLQKLREVLVLIPSIRQVIDIDDCSTVDGSIEITSLRRIEKNGANSLTYLPPKSVNTKDDIAIIAFASDTTGPPKGVIVTHGQIIAQLKSLLSFAEDILPEVNKHLYIAFLPAGHISEFLAELFFMGIGVRIGYSTTSTLIDGALGLVPGEVSDVQLLKPTLMITFSSMVDWIRRRIYENLATQSFLYQMLFNHMINYKDYWRFRGYKTFITDYIFCRNYKQLLGGRMQFIIVEDEQLMSDTQRDVTLIFDSLVMQSYGSEACSFSHLTSIYDLSYGLVGAPLHGIKVKLIDWADGEFRTSDKPNSRGEIVMNGGCIASGYCNLPVETEKNFRIDNNGEFWYHTGDIGEVMPDGRFRIIGRKDLIKSQNRKHVSLSGIEAALKQCLLVDHIFVYSQSSEDFLIALVVPNVVALCQLAHRFGIKNLSLDLLCVDSQIVSVFCKTLVNYALQIGLTQFETPKKFKLLSDHWTPFNGMLTSKFKLKRKVIAEYYKHDLEKLSSQEINNN